MLIIPKMSPIALFAFALCIGCGGTTMSTGTQGVSWIKHSDDPIPGIDTGGVDIVTINAGGTPLKFAIWTQGPGSGNSNTSNGSYKSTITIGDGSVVNLRCESKRGDTGAMSINGQDFALSNGLLFLIAAGDGEPKVLQLAHDMDTFPTNTAGLQSLASDTEPIREFFTRAKPDPTP